MTNYNVLVTHERHRHQATTVDIDAPDGLTGKQYERLGREHLRKTDYPTYLFVTEYPQAPDHVNNPHYDAWYALYQKATGCPW